MSKKKPTEHKRYTLTGWSPRAIQSVIDRFHEVTKTESFPVEAVEIEATFKQTKLIDINGQWYALAYFTYEPT